MALDAALQDAINALRAAGIGGQTAATGPAVGAGLNAEAIARAAARNAGNPYIGPSNYVAPQPAPAFGTGAQTAARAATAAPQAAPLGRFAQAAKTAGSFYKSPVPVLARGGMKLGAGLLKTNPLTYAPAAAGAIAATAAGAPVSMGLSPTDFGTALGEGYARVMPTWLGGLSKGTIEAGDQFGASVLGEKPAAATVVPSAAAGASNDLASELSVGAPAVPVNTLTGPPETASPQDLQADIQSRSIAADSLLRQADKVVGRSGGTVAGANERIRNFGANPAAVETFNAAQQLNRTGIKLSYDERGQPLLSGDPSARPNFYVGADGKPTTKYEETQQYQQGVELAAKERAQLADIESGNLLKEALADIGRKKTVPGKKLAIDLFGHLATAQTARDTSSRLGAIEGRKAGIEGGKLQLDLIRTMAEAGDKSAQAALRGLQLKSILAGDTDTALLAAGKEPRSEKFTIPQGGVPITFDPLKPTPVLQQNTTTGELVLKTPSAQVRFAKATDGNFYRVGPDGKLTTTQATKEEEAKLRAR